MKPGGCDVNVRLAHVRSAAFVAALLTLACASCVSDRYIIGRVDGAGGVGSGSGGAGAGGTGGITGGPGCTAGGVCRFAAGLDSSGVGQLPETLPLASGAVTASLRYRGERADTDGWHADRGELLPPATGSARRGLNTPFTDATLAVGLATDAASFQAATAGPGAVAASDFVVELVFRAAPNAPVVGKGTAAAGWTLAVNAAGALVLTLGDGTNAVPVPSEVLTPRAWYHCLAWVSHAAGARIDCDGRAGTARDLTGLGNVDGGAPLVIGGAAAGGAGAAAIQVALFQQFIVGPGALGDPATWQALARRRFAALTGIYPRFAAGSPLPRDGLRATVAYVDIQLVQRGQRLLFLVGADWPRIACRPDIAGTRGCGYLAEPARGQLVDPDPGMWTAGELSVVPSDRVFVDGDQRMSGLLASTATAAHALSRQATFSGPRQSLSFFAKAGAGRMVGVSVASHGRAVFDLESGTLVTAPAGAAASIEDWGNGTHRCLYTFQVEGGALDYRLSLLDGNFSDTFAGTGATPWIYVSGLQLEANQAYTGTLLALPHQAADQLTYEAGDGNVPAGVVAMDLGVLLPSDNRLVDQSIININRDAAPGENQIDLFVAGNLNNFEFRGLAGGKTSWGFMHPSTVLDGVQHALSVTWGGDREEISVDGLPMSVKASSSTPPPTAMDRLDVGFSHNTAHLQGLLAGLQIRTP